MDHLTVRSKLATQDMLRERLCWAFVVSLFINLILWRAAAAMARQSVASDPKPVEITRVIVDTKGRKVEKIVTKKQIEHKMVQVHKQIEQRKIVPVPRQPERTAKPPTRKAPVVKPIQVAQKPPEDAHNRILTAKPDNKAPAPDDHVVLPGGNAAVGKPVERQGEGSAKVNTPEPTKPAPPPTIKQPEPEKPVAKVEPAPTKTNTEPAPTKVEPKTEPEPVKVIPKKKGATKDAEPDDQAKPEIPDDLKHGDYKSFVRVKVEINEDGSFTATLRTSSGNAEIDKRVLDALKKWRWKPALKDGVAVKSTQLFKFEFEVQ